MRIALISDIHYGKLSTTSELSVSGEQLDIGEVHTSKPLFEGLINSLKEEKPNYLLITGDLTSSGSPLEFKDCYCKLSQMVSSVGIAPSKVIICLGNHDLDWRISELNEEYVIDGTSTDNKKFLEEKYLQLSYSWSMMFEGEAKDICPQYDEKYSTPLTGVIDTDECVFFVLNSAHLCKKNQVIRHGRLTESQLKWFEEVVSRYKESAKAKIVLLHHHPMSYPFPSIGHEISTLEEGAEFLEVCGSGGIDLVIHGHRHHPKAITVTQRDWVNPVTYICAGSLSVNATHRCSGEIPNTFHIIDYVNKDDIVLRNYIYRSFDGWVLNRKSDPATPIDGHMRLGKCIDDSTALSLISQLHVEEFVDYNSLPDDLMYISLERLNKLTHQIFDAENVITGDFPGQIYIHPRKR